MYNYTEAVKADIREYLADNAEYIAERIDVTDADALYDYIFDLLFVCDSVTGNASGSYTFNRAQAEEYVKENINLAVEAFREFGYELEDFAEKIEDEEWEYIDVTIRCYVLGQVLGEVLEEERVGE